MIAFRYICSMNLSKSQLGLFRCEDIRFAHRP